MSGSDHYLPFSQRAGLAPIPPQLKPGEVSEELRRLLNYALKLETDTGAAPGAYSRPPRPFRSNWKRVAMDLHVHVFKQDVETFRNSVGHHAAKFRQVVETGNIGEIFDLLEYMVRHPVCSGEFKQGIRDAFVRSRAAYRVVGDGTIVAIGTEETAHTYIDAISSAESHGATGARHHLIAAGLALRIGDWAGSVRESIHAVESVAVLLAPPTGTLGDALKVLEKRGHLHGALKAAFCQLYGYSCDEGGVRHALVLQDKAQVDETDAIFMLGACASFVSYLLARGL